MNRLDFKTVADAALAAADHLLAEWLPQGRYDGHEYVALNPTRADKRAGSFRINTRSGSWADFATDDTGGDLVSLYAYLFCGGRQGEALRQVAERLNVGNFAPVEKKEFEGAAKKSRDEDWLPLMPVPDFALKSMNFRHKFREGEPLFTSVFHDAAGKVLGAVARFAKSDGGKLDLPYTFCRHRETGVQEWRWRGWPTPRPLYGLDALSAQPDALVLVVEGEKCKNAADAAGLPVAAVTWHGGVNNWDKTDWSALSNRRVIMWPDADAQREKLSRAEAEAGIVAESKPLLPLAEQPGTKAMRGLAAKLTEQGCTVEFVKLPAPGVWPAGYDIADALADKGRLIDPQTVLSWQGWADYLEPYRADAAMPSAAPETSPAPASSFVQSPNAADGMKQGTPGSGGQGAAFEMPEFKDPKTAEALECMRRDLALVEGKDKAVNRKTGTEYSRRAMLTHYGKEAVEVWYSLPGKLVLTPFEINRIKKHRQLMEASQDEETIEMMARYIYLDGSSSIWDNHLWRLIDEKSARMRMNPDGYKTWITHPARLIKRFDRLVFEPGREMPPEYINIYRGMPLENKAVFPCPKDEMPADWLEVIALFPQCRAIQKLIAHLCNGNMQAIQFVYNWLAYPLQNVGAKMTTALVFHGDVHGAGKSFLFEEIIKPMYGDYAITLGQSDLESTYTGNRSGKLFVLFEEIFNNKQKYDQSGAMKHMITGKTMRVEKKFVDAYEEANHINCVFLSNEPQPFKIEENDRRYFVIWPESKLPDDLRDALVEEIGNGGIEAFYSLLLSLPLMVNYREEATGNPEEPYRSVLLEEPKRFDPNTPPPMTQAKRNVIAFGRYTWQVFWAEWQSGEIDGVPFCACIREDLFKLYEAWCRRGKEREIVKHKFYQNIGTRMTVARRWWRVPNSNRPEEKKQDYIFILRGQKPPENTPMMDWVGPQVLRFRQAVEKYCRKHDPDDYL